MAEARAIACPTLVLHGGSDRIVPPKQAHLAFAAAGAPEQHGHEHGRARKTLAIIELAGHNDIAMSDKYFQEIAAFLDAAIALHESNTAWWAKT